MYYHIANHNNDSINSSVFSRPITGYYMYMNTTNVTAGLRFNLTTVYLNQLASGPYKLTFWYHMYGVHIGTLNVYGINAAGMRSDAKRSMSGGSLGESP